MSLATWLNGLGSLLRIETPKVNSEPDNCSVAKWPGEPVKD